MTAIEYAESRLAELPKLWDSRDTTEASDTAWIRLFLERMPRTEDRTCGINLGEGGFYHEWPKDRVLVYRIDGKEIYGILPKPPIDWTVEGPKLLQKLKVLGGHVSIARLAVRDVHCAEFPSELVRDMRETMARLSHEP